MKLNFVRARGGENGATVREDTLDLICGTLSSTLGSRGEGDRFLGKTARRLPRS